MLIPIGDQPNPRGVPIVNNLLIGLNIAVFAFLTLPLMNQGVEPWSPDVQVYVWHIARQTGIPPEYLLSQLSAYDVFVYRWAYRPAEPSAFTLLFSMFLHAGWAHLLGNMLFLWIFGDNVEHRLGRVRYLLAYLGTGIAAALFHGFLRIDADLPMLGASGAISGVLGFYFVWFPKNHVRMLFFLYFILDVVLIPARWVLGFYLVIDNLLPFFLAGDAGGVAHSAHIGGFIAGVIVAWLSEAATTRSVVDGWLAEQPAPGESGFTWAREALDAGRPDLASRSYFRLSPEEQGSFDAEEIAEMSDWLVAQEHTNVAYAMLKSYIALRPRDRAVAPLHVRAGYLCLYHHSRPTDAYQHLMAALALRPGAEVEQQIHQALAEIEKLQKLRVRGR